MMASGCCVVASLTESVVRMPLQGPVGNPGLIGARLMIGRSSTRVGRSARIGVGALRAEVVVVVEKG
jgi:hypothetical protein